MKGVRFFSALVSFLLTASAWAHPGHPTFYPGHTNHFFDIELVFVSALVVLAIAGGIFVRRLIRSEISKR